MGGIISVFVVSDLFYGVCEHYKGCGNNVSKFLKNNKKIVQGNIYLYVFITAMFLITIMNRGLLGYKYGAIGNYDKFLNLILYPPVAYIFPILSSILFFVFLNQIMKTLRSVYFI